MPDNLRNYTKYYNYSHHSQATCWEHPTTKKRYKVDNGMYCKDLEISYVTGEIFEI